MDEWTAGDGLFTILCYLEDLSRMMYFVIKDMEEEGKGRKEWEEYLKRGGL